MAKIAATDPYQTAVDALATLLAASTVWQTFLGEVNAAGAAKHIMDSFVRYTIDAYQVTASTKIFTLQRDVVMAAGDYLTVEGTDAAVDGEYQVSVATANVVTVDKTKAGVALSGLTPVAATSLANKGSCFKSVYPMCVLGIEAENMDDERVAIDTPAYGGKIDIRLTGTVSTAYQNDPENAKREMVNNLGLLKNAIYTAGTMIVNKIPIKESALIRMQQQNSNRIQYERWLAHLQVSYGWPFTA